MNRTSSFRIAGARFVVVRPTALALALAAALPALASPPSTSPYNTDTQHTYVEDATSKGVSQVNMITCFMSSMRPDGLVNQGNYLAMVDKNKCDPEARSSTDNASATDSSAAAPDYMTAVVNSARASNADPMRAKVWVDEEEEGASMTIYINVSATEAPSSTNPYGAFRMDYCGKPAGSTGSCGMRGYLEGSSGGISYFEDEGGGRTKALRLQTSNDTNGSGTLQMNESGQNVAYSFAYNANLFRRSDGTNDQCFSRDASDADTGMSVWRYGLYDATSGEKIERNSGFPIDYTSGGQTIHGHMGYWGLGMPNNVSIPNGATVQRVQYVPNQAPTKTDYTLVKADGRLMKYTKNTRTLASTDKIHFHTWISDATNFFSGATSNQQYEMYWDDTAGAFKVTGTMECSPGNPCQTRDLSAEQTVQVSFFVPMGGVRGWSQALGGELFVPLVGVSGPIDSATQDVIYRTQDLVYPADMPSTLYCLRDCPTAASIGAYFADNSNTASPFVDSTYNNWMPTSAGNVVSYTLDATSALLKDATDSAVTFTNSEALQTRPQYQNGVRTGRLFETLVDAQCQGNVSQYCDYKVEEMPTYYQWETGPNQWNQFAALKDGSGTMVTFDAPLQVTYAVPSGAAYGDYAGKSIVLQYGGFGELWGIPGQCVSRVTNDPVSCDTPDSRYVPAFVIPFSETLGQVANGNTTLLAKWLDREVRFARKNLSVCTDANVTLPTGLTLPTSASLDDPSDPDSDMYIGSKPSVTDAPRVIHGEVMY